MKRQYIQPQVKKIQMVHTEIIATSSLYSSNKSADDSAILSNGTRGFGFNGWNNHLEQ